MSKGIRQFRPSDVDQLNLIDSFDEEVDVAACAQFVMNWRSGSAPAYTICFPGTDRPLACVSGQYEYTKCMRLSALVDAQVHDYPIYYAKHMRRLINMTFQKLHLNRMDITIRTDQAWAKSWANFLGFELEGLLRKYNEDAQDYYLFSRVR